jgi:superoxide dismutase, Fe-Mn family
MPYPFKLPDLPYAFDALEPHIDAKTMEIHHGKHHAAYTNKLNEALEKHPDLQGRSIEELLRGIDSRAGGHPHRRPQQRRRLREPRLFWEIMGPGGGGEPTGELADAIKQKFGSFATSSRRSTRPARPVRQRLGLAGGGDGGWTSTRRPTRTAR